MMRKLLLGGLLAFVAFGTAYAQGSHYVRGYVTKNGTYVAPHYQTNPDNNPYNNWSTQGNVNPYTGQAGNRSPYSTPSYGYTPAPAYQAPTYAQPTYRAPAYSTPTYGYTPPKPPCYYGTSC